MRVRGARESRGAERDAGTPGRPIRGWGDYPFTTARGMSFATFFAMPAPFGISEGIGALFGDDEPKVAQKVI